MTTTPDEIAQSNHRVDRRHFGSMRGQMVASAHASELPSPPPSERWRSIKDVTRALPSAKYSAIYASVVQAARMQQGWVKRDPHRWLIDIQSPEYQRYTHYWTHQEGPPPAQPSTDQPDLLVATSNTLWEPFLAGDDDPNPLGPEHEEEGQEASDDLLLHPPFLYPYPLHITLPLPKLYWRNQLVYLVLVLQLITIAGLLLPYVLRLMLG